MEPYIEVDKYVEKIFENILMTDVKITEHAANKDNKKIRILCLLQFTENYKMINLLRELIRKLWKRLFSRT